MPYHDLGADHDEDAMREVIPHGAGPDLPGYVVESSEGAESVRLDADGVSLWFTPEAARRIGQALLGAASRAEFRLRTTDGGGSAPDDDLPDVR